MLPVCHAGALPSCTLPGARKKPARGGSSVGVAGLLRFLASLVACRGNTEQAQAEQRQAGRFGHIIRIDLQVIDRKPAVVAVRTDLQVRDIAEIGGNGTPLAVHDGRCCSRTDQVVGRVISEQLDSARIAAAANELTSEISAVKGDLGVKINVKALRSAVGPRVGGAGMSTS